jgi:hypothetical protein
MQKKAITFAARRSAKEDKQRLIDSLKYLQSQGFDINKIKSRIMINKNEPIRETLRWVARNKDQTPIASAALLPFRAAASPIELLLNTLYRKAPRYSPMTDNINISNPFATDNYFAEEILGANVKSDKERQDTVKPIFLHELGHYLDFAKSRTPIKHKETYYPFILRSEMMASIAALKAAKTKKEQNFYRKVLSGALGSYFSHYLPYPYYKAYDELMYKNPKFNPVNVKFENIKDPKKRSKAAMMAIAHMHSNPYEYNGWKHYINLADRVLKTEFINYGNKTDYIDLNRDNDRYKRKPMNEWRDDYTTRIPLRKQNV